MPSNTQKSSRPRTARLRNRSLVTRNTSLLKGDGRVYSSASVQPREPDDSIKTFSILKTVINQAIITASVAIVTNVSKQFTLADVDDYASWTAVFDQYRITSIECYISPQGSNSNHANDGKLTTVVDYDDAASLTGQKALDYSNAVTSSMLSNQYRHFVPHAADAFYNTGAAFTAFGNVPAPWIDCAYPSVPHYGLKLLTQVASGAYVSDLVYRMHIQFRNIL